MLVVFSCAIPERLPRPSASPGRIIGGGARKSTSGWGGDAGARASARAGASSLAGTPSCAILSSLSSLSPTPREVPMKLLHDSRSLWAALMLRSRTAHLLPAAAAAIVGVLASSSAVAQGTGALTGKIVDTSTKKPLADVVVTATSPALQGEQTVVT